MTLASRCRILFAGLALCAAGPLLAQQPGPDTVAAISAGHDALVRFGAESERAVWPGYRPDTIPVLYVLPGRGTFLLGWRWDAPEGFAPVPGAAAILWRGTADRGAASTSVALDRHPTAQAVVDDLSVPALAGLAAHEAFHVFERASQRPGRRFGHAENLYYFSQYPVFDPDNEAGVALEGRLLRAALEARSAAAVRDLIQQFVAVRERRQRALGATLADFEQMAELNEGLAEYALVRARQFAGDTAFVRRKTTALDSLTADMSLSFRLRFYVTGPASGMLLDRAMPGWQAEVMRGDLTLQDALARASGYRTTEEARTRAAERRFDAGALAAQARSRVADLQLRRRRQADSILARPGLTVAFIGDVGQCGFDPQNLLRVSGDVDLHTRWLHLCSGGSFDAEFNTPVVADGPHDSYTAVVGPAESVRLTVRGAPVDVASLTHLVADSVRIASPGLALRVLHADLTKDGSILRVRLLP